MSSYNQAEIDRVDEIVQDILTRLDGEAYDLVIMGLGSAICTATKSTTTQSADSAKLINWTLHYMDELKEEIFDILSEEGAGHG